MRDIKFRAWDKEREYFIANSGVFINGIGSIYVQDMHYGTINKIDDDSIDIMLYTGLTDIKNKKIYKGDILEITYEGISGLINKKNVIVEFKNGGFGVDVAGGFIFLSKLDISNMEIIGNIYENPELLS